MVKQFALNHLFIHTMDRTFNCFEFIFDPSVKSGQYMEICFDTFRPHAKRMFIFNELDMPKIIEIVQHKPLIYLPEAYGKRAIAT